MARIPLAVLVCLGALLVPACFAQRSDFLSRLPPPGSLSVAHYFPEHPNKQFPAGGEIKVVVSAHNDAKTPYNITAMMGSLNSPTDFDMYIQNFTQQVYFQLLPPGEELSVEYTFRPDPILSPREFIVALHLIYEDPATGALHSNTVFNSTIDIVEMPKLVDTEMLFMYLMLISVAVGGGYYTYLNVADKMGLNKGKAKKAKKASAAPAEFDADEWVKNTNYDVQKRKAAAAGAKTKAVKA